MNIVYASTDPIAGGSFKKIAEDLGVKAYILTELSELSYILDDLEPRSFICSSKFYDENRAVLSDYLSNYTGIKILCSDKKDELFDKNWSKDLDLFNLKDQLEEVLKA